MGNTKLDSHIKQTPEWIEKGAAKQRGIPWSDDKRTKIMAGIEVWKTKRKNNKGK